MKFQLTREVRFAVNDDDSPATRSFNGFGGAPPLTGLGRWYALQVTLSGEIDPSRGYIRDIKEVDRAVRERAIPIVADAARSGRRFDVILALTQTLKDCWPGSNLTRLRLCLTPFLSIETRSSELPMMRLSQKFEFSASHRLHNPALDEATNRRAFGKCNNPHGHGHNYQLEVTLRGKPTSAGQLMNMSDFERIVSESVIDKLDHKNLNVEIAEFREVIPSVENIAMVIYQILQPKLKDSNGELAAVTVWETPKTWCEYSEKEHV